MVDLYNKARDYAFKLLTYRPRSKKEIRGKLQSKNFPGTIIDQVITMLEDYNFVNDREFAALWIQNRCQVKPTGRWKLKQELLLKGIDNHIIDEQIGLLVNDEKELILAEALIRNKKKFEGASRQKIYNFLRRRGFSRDTANRIIADYKSEDPEDPYR